MWDSGRPARKSMRYAVKAPVSFCWKDAEGHEREGERSSRDVRETLSSSKRRARVQFYFLANRGEVNPVSHRAELYAV
jgi:hypothetical protein